MSIMYKLPPVISFQGRTAVRFLEAITSLTISDNVVTSTRHVKVSKKKVSFSSSNVAGLPHVGLCERKADD